MPVRKYNPIAFAGNQNRKAINSYPSLTWIFRKNKYNSDANADTEIPNVVILTSFIDNFAMKSILFTMILSLIPMDNGVK